MDIYLSWNKVICLAVFLSLYLHISLSCFWVVAVGSGHSAALDVQAMITPPALYPSPAYE